ncbi:SCO family protein [Kiritimatiellota bacterium B12222]|nr:SCO family protein [Kiritimatiellota bacterium B12222]
MGTKNILLKVLSSLLIFTSCAMAQEVESPYVSKDPRSEPFLNVSFSPTLDTQVPLDLEFMGDDGQRSSIRDRLIPGKPTILAIVYYRCPTMCNQVLNGLVQTMKEINYVPGKDFNLLAISFDAEETHVTAAAKKLTYMTDYESDDPTGWNFMVGNEPEIRELTSAVGFGFKYDAMDDQYSHGSGLLVLTPDGKISRFLPGMMYPLMDTRLALVEASEGKVGTLSDKIALLCYDYDPETHKYGLLIHRVIMIACLVTVAALAWLIISLIRLEKKRDIHPQS